MHIGLEDGELHASIHTVLFLKEVKKNFFFFETWSPFIS